MKKTTTYLEKLCKLYILLLIACVVLSLIAFSIFDDTIFYSATGCQILDPAPFPGVICDHSFVGTLLQFILNLPINFMVVSVFGFSSTKGLIYIIALWAPILFLFSINWHKKRVQKKEKAQIDRKTVG